ncbi:hypothetical protein PMAYCL1PPCAC_19563, partial [Pristionchus mayeri]
CSKCGKKLCNKYYLRKHVLIHTVAPRRRVRKSKDVELASVNVLPVSAADIVEPYACLTCGMKFEVKAWLREHLITNQGHQEQVTRRIDVMQPQLCDLCGRKAFPFLISPGDPSLARDFVNHLVGLTPNQWSTVNYFINHNRRALICRNQYRDASRGEDILSNEVKRRRHDGLGDERTPFDNLSYGHEDTIEHEDLTDEPGPSRKWK